MTAARSTTDRLEVVVARIAPGLQISSSASNSTVFTARSSTTASTTRSRSARSSSCVVPDTIASAASRASAVSLPRATPLSSERSRLARTRATLSSPRATYSTSTPALAKTSMMPVAIVPEPTTPTLSTVRVRVVGRCSGVGVSASETTTGELGAS